MCEMICKPSFRVYVLENARVITQLTMAIRVYDRSLLSFTPRKAWGGFRRRYWTSLFVTLLNDSVDRCNMLLRDDLKPYSHAKIKYADGQNLGVGFDALLIEFDFSHDGRRRAKQLSKAMSSCKAGENFWDKLEDITR